MAEILKQRFYQNLEFKIKQDPIDHLTGSLFGKTSEIIDDIEMGKTPVKQEQIRNIVQNKNTITEKAYITMQETYLTINQILNHKIDEKYNDLVRTK